MKRHSIPGIYLVYTFPMKLCAPPGCRISFAMQQHIGLGLQGCLMFCRMWQQCHWASVSQPEGRAVARLAVGVTATGYAAAARGARGGWVSGGGGPRRQSRAAYVGGTAATDAHCSGGGAEPPPPQSPIWAAMVGSLSLRRRPLPRRRGRTAADDDDDKAKSL
jgi:hypothetical protein